MEFRFLCCSDPARPAAAELTAALYPDPDIFPESENEYGKYYKQQSNRDFELLTFFC